MSYKKGYTNVPYVLVVADNQDDLYLIGYILEGMNLKYYGISDSEKVLDLAIDQTPEFIVLDIVMPKISGFDIISQLKSNIFTKDIPVIAVTGLDRFYYQSKIASAGFDDCIYKPFAFEDFEAKLKSSFVKFNFQEIFFAI
ncbi:response regulator [Pleurocapsa sp. FMAR1]|uniref:response regulator n=1 Tax=Pleurocapsa sp. FMAR1 TaxID=3040204 RepID=UPI0029C6852D|nr:response regulator [Pleurocapsa sp. FMAR1]